MKSLYESIIGSNGAGILESVKKWLNETIGVQAPLSEFEVNINGKKIDVVVKYLPSTNFVIEDKFLKNGELPYPINSVVNDSGFPLTVCLRDCNIKSFKNFPNNDHIKFLGCKIEDLSSLPSSYKLLEFYKSHNLSGGYVNEIKKCTGLKIDTWLADGSGYSFDINGFKNNNIKNFCLSTLCKGGTSLTNEEIVERIIDNNNIKPENITVMFYNDDAHNKLNRGRVEKKAKGEYKYTIVKDSSKHKEIRNGYFG